MTFIQTVMRKKTEFQYVHHPKNGRRSAQGLFNKLLLSESEANLHVFLTELAQSYRPRN